MPTLATLTGVKIGVPKIGEVSPGASRPYRRCVSVYGGVIVEPVQSTELSFTVKVIGALA